MSKFRLQESFIRRYKTLTPPWGFGVLSELVYYRTYSRIKSDGSNEQWWETVRRVVEGCYEMQRRWIADHKLGWNGDRAQKSAREMYDRMFNMKFLPPGRGLWAMGSPIVEERGLYAALNNCAFVSTRDDSYPSRPYRFLMDMSMLGVGVGFDTKGSGLKVSRERGRFETYVIPDTREGWVESVGKLLDSYLGVYAHQVEFDYSQIRGAGLPIKGFGGVSSGPDPLIKLHERLTGLLESYCGKTTDARFVVDVMNMIGACVVAGNVRRTAEISLGDYADTQFLDLKNYQLNPERMEYGWTSNNSIYAKTGMNYKEVAERTRINGEPGYFWLGNTRDYGRMGREPDFKDHRAVGTNPCAPGYTPILTTEGYKPIDSLVDKAVSVWNGREWSTVTPFHTGNKPVYRVSFSDLTELDCTANHKFVLKGGVRKELKDLEEGDVLERFDMPVVHYGEEPSVCMYSQGFYSADGTKNRRLSFLYGEKIGLAPRLCGKLGPKYGDRQVWHHGWMGPKDYVPIELSVQGRIDWLAGFLDGDGTVVRNPNSVGLQATSTNLEFLRKIRLMLTTLGVQAKIAPMSPARVVSMPDGKGGAKDYNCQPTWRLLITAVDTARLVDLGLNCGRLKLDKTNPQRDARRFVTFTGAEYIGDMDVYCFNEPINHTGTFNGVVTGQCSEQSLESYELCCLVETFPHKHESLEDYKETLKYAYLYAKTVTLGPTHWEETNNVMARNRRIGCSMTGVAQFIASRSISELRKWCNLGYDEVQRLDKKYSDWLCVPRSIKTTSVKPSGTVSLLAGATPGVHYPESRFYIRRMRLSIHSPMVAPLVEAGYKVEPCVGSEDSTVVVEIPVAVKEDIRTVAEVSMWEQLELTAFMQEHWADNQVSVTVTFDPEKEGHQIEKALDFYQFRLKSVSFLPRIDYGAFPQMPYQAITENEYHSIASGLKEVSLHLSGEEATPEVYCDSDGCVVL